MFLLLSTFISTTLALAYFLDHKLFKTPYITFDTSAINYTGKRLLDNPFDSPRSIVSRLIKIKIVRGEGGGE